MPEFWFKEETILRAVFPQHPSFCGVAACCGAANALLGLNLTQEKLHEDYGIGSRTRLRLSPGDLPPNLGDLPLEGKGMSNWDVIRLFNSILLDVGRSPHSAIVCGADFVRETANEENLRRLLSWLRQPTSQAVIHLVGHYALAAGLLLRVGDPDAYLLLADSARSKGPVRSLRLREVQNLAAGDERYGWILLSDRPIPSDLFLLWTQAMQPAEIKQQERFVRRGTTERSPCR